LSSRREAIPKEIYGNPSAIHTYFQEWHRAGFFTELWRRGLSEYDGMEGIAREWLSADRTPGKAPLALESVGPNPTDWVNKEARSACW